MSLIYMITDKIKKKKLKIEREGYMLVWKRGRDNLNALYFNCKEKQHSNIHCTYWYYMEILTTLINILILLL